MNKRLLLSLYDRSGLGAYLPVALKGHELQVEEHMEKFAELIVRECIHVAIYKSDGLIFTADTAGYMAAGRTSAAKMIKEHFGVSE